MAHTPDEIHVTAKIDDGEVRALLAHAAGETAGALLAAAHVAAHWQRAHGTVRLAMVDRAPQLAAALDALPQVGTATGAPGSTAPPRTQLRCPNCDHLATAHSEGGCWYTLSNARQGVDLVCQCTATHVAGITAQAPDDLWIIGWALHRAAGCISDHALDARLNDEDEHAAQTVADALTRHGRLAGVPALEPSGDAARALKLAELRLRTMAIALETKGGQHRATAAGVRLATVKIIELADRIGQTSAGPHTLGAVETADVVWRGEIAAMLRWLAQARKHYNQHAPASVAAIIDAECSAVERIAIVIEGDLAPLYGWLPSHLWTDDMVQALAGRTPWKPLLPHENGPHATRQPTATRQQADPPHEAPTREHEHG